MRSDSLRTIKLVTDVTDALTQLLATKKKPAQK